MRHALLRSSCARSARAPRDTPRHSTAMGYSLFPPYDRSSTSTRCPIDISKSRKSSPIEGRADLPIFLANKLCPRGELATCDTRDRVCSWLWLARVNGGRGCCTGQVGTTVNAGTWRGWTLSKSLRFMVAMVATPSRSATATSEASVPPNRRSAGHAHWRTAGRVRTFAAGRGQ